MIESPSSVAQQSLVTPTSSFSQPQLVLSESKAKKRTTTKPKTHSVTAAAADARHGNTSRSRAKSQHSYSAVITSQPTSVSCRKQRWNALVRNSAPLTHSFDDDVSADSTAATNGTSSREKEIAAAKNRSAKHNCTTDCRVNNGCHSTSYRTSSRSSSSSSSSRRYIDSSDETEASAYDCRSRKEYRERRSAVSPLSSLSSSSSTAAFTTQSSLSSSSRIKRRRLNAATKCGRCCEDDSCRFDCHHSGCCHRPLHGCRGRHCRCTCRRYRHCNDNRHVFHDDERYGAPLSSCRQSARQSAIDRPPINVAPTEQHVYSRTPSSFAHHPPGTILRPDTAAVSGLDQPFIKQEPPEDYFNAPLFGAGRRSCHLPSISTASSFAADPNNTADIRSSSTFGDRLILTSAESCPIPLEPVSGLPLPIDPRRLWQRQLTTNVTTVETAVNELDIIQPNKVNVKSFNPLKGSGIRWLHFKVFSAIQI